MADNFWDQLMGSDETAATYMDSYGEGPSCPTRYKIGAFINDGESVLDVGCGPAWNADHFNQFGPQINDYTGIDYSPRFVRVARKRLLFNDMKFDWSIVPGDCRDLSILPKQYYDVVILQDCLEHTNGYEKPVTEALRVADKRIIVTFWHLDDTDNPHINDDGNDGWGAWYDKREWEKFLDSLPYPWLVDEFEYPAGVRQRQVYVIDKEQPK